MVDLFRSHYNIPLVAVDAGARFLAGLAGVTDPEDKRKTIGRLFVEVFDEEAEKIGKVDFLAQGTLYPDVIESVSFPADRRRPSNRITMSADCRSACSSGWSSRCASYSKTR